MTGWKIEFILFISLFILQCEKQNCKSLETSDLDAKLSALRNKGYRREPKSNIVGVGTRTVFCIFSHCQTSINPTKKSSKSHDSSPIKNEMDLQESLHESNSTIDESNKKDDSSNDTITNLESSLLDDSDGENSFTFIDEPFNLNTSNPKTDPLEAIKEGNSTILAGNIQENSSEKNIVPIISAMSEGGNEVDSSTEIITQSKSNFSEPIPNELEMIGPTIKLHSTNEPFTQLNSTLSEKNDGVNSSVLIDGQSNQDVSNSFQSEPDPMEAIKQLNLTILKGANQETASGENTGQINSSKIEESKKDYSSMMTNTTLNQNLSKAVSSEPHLLGSIKQLNSTALESNDLESPSARSLMRTGSNTEEDSNNHISSLFPVLASKGMINCPYITYVSERICFW